MADADHLRVVFRVGKTGFIMPVVELLMIGEFETDSFDAMSACADEYKLGTLQYRDVDVPLRDLAALFGLPEQQLSETSRYLVFAGADLPWAIVADQVEGVVSAAQYPECDLPGYFFPEGRRLYQRAVLRDGVPLVCCEVATLDHAWGQC